MKKIKWKNNFIIFSFLNNHGNFLSWTFPLSSVRKQASKVIVFLHPFNRAKIDHGLASPVVVSGGSFSSNTHGKVFLWTSSIVLIGFMLLAHSFFCLGHKGHNNAGLKTQACQSNSGRVLSLNRQENIGPHPAPWSSSEVFLSYQKLINFFGLSAWKRN